MRLPRGLTLNSFRSPLRVNRSCILWLGARRKGIARCAALHLDCAPSAGEEVAMISREEFFVADIQRSRFLIVSQN
jgi:hypothetical protein